MTRDEAQDSLSLVLWVLLKYLGFIIFKLLAVGHICSFQSFQNISIYLYVFMIDLAGSSWLHGLFSSCGEQGLLSCCGAQALGAQASVLVAHGGLVAPPHVGSSWVRGQTRVSCLGRRILCP